MNLLDAPIWNDAGAWVVLSLSLLFIVAGIVIMMVLQVPQDDATNKEKHV